MRRWLIRQSARLVAADPGLRRLRAAGRVIGGVVVTLGVLIPSLLALGQSPISAALGAVVVLLSQLAVTESGKAAQAITTLLLSVSATASLSIAALLAGSSLYGELAFVGVMFAATYLRRFGPRAGALGFAAFIAFFLALFLRVTLVQVPAVAGCAVVGALAGLLVRFVLWPERGEAVRRSGIRALRARVRTMLDAMDDQLEQPGPRRSRRVHDELMRLNQTALAVEADLDALREHSAEQADRLRRMVLEVELAAERLVGTLTGVLRESEVTSDVRAVLAELGTTLRRDPRVAADVARKAADRLELEGSVPAAFALRRLGSAAGELTEATRSLLAEVDEPVDDQKEDTAERDAETDETAETAEATDDEEAGDENADDEEKKPGDRDEHGLRPTTRAAIQVACAGAAAIFLGGLVSDTRWYWAVITAFVVFAGTGSRGELLVKAWRRTVGTLFGVVAGVGVALLVSGQPILQIAVVLGCVFLAFYLVSVSYAAMTFFITTMLGVLYEILGRFSVHILEVRLVETAIGAAAGAAAALLLLPARTRKVVRDDADELLRGLRDLLRNAAEDLRSAAELRDLAPDSRTVDERMQALLTSASPLGSYRVGNSREGYERWRLLISSSAYYSRNLASVLPPAARMSDEDTRGRLATFVGTLADLAEGLSEHDVDTARQLIERAEQSERELSDIAESLPAGDTSLRAALHTLTRLQGTLTDLTTLAARRTPQPAEQGA